MKFSPSIDNNKYKMFFFHANENQDTGLLLSVSLFKIVLGNKVCLDNISLKHLIILSFKFAHNPSRGCIISDNNYYI